MKLCTFIANGCQRVGIFLDETRVADATLAYKALLESQGKKRSEERACALVPSNIISFLEGGDESVQAVREAEAFLRKNPQIKSINGEKVVFEKGEFRLRAPVPRPGVIYCGVLGEKRIRPSLRTWAANKIPTTPYYFLKVPGAVVGAMEPIEVPEEVLTWPEVELACIINRKAKKISASDVPNYIIGYTVSNDVTAGGLHSEETLHYLNPDGSEGMPFRMFARYKGFDTHCPMGPWIVTKDEVPDIGNLTMKCWIDDLLASDGNINGQAFTLAETVAHISAVHTLYPGDVILSGAASPAKGRLAKDNDLRTGKICKCEIERIGSLTNPLKLVKTGLVGSAPTML